MAITDVGLINGAGPARLGLNRWAMVTFLAVFYSLSLLDRFILALLAVPITAELDISRTELGLLIGMGFAILYTVVGVPLAHWIDVTRRRIWIVAGGVISWSVCTTLSAVAPGFAELLLCRAGVAIGEAVLAPAAISLISDMFGRQERTLPTTIYNAVGTVSATGSFVIGGLVFDLASVWAPDLAISAWRLTLALIGGGGILLGLLFLFAAREPRRQNEHMARSETASLGQVAAYVWRERRVYGFMYFGWALGTIVSLSVVVWTGSLLIQAYGMAVDEASYLFGSIGMVAGVSGIFLWPSLLVMATRRGRPDAMVLLLAFATLLGSLATILLGLSPNRFGALCGLAGVMFGFSVWSALPSLIVQNLSPGQMRGRLISFNLLSANVIGLTIGPPLIAALADNVFEGPRALGYALAASAAIVGPVAAIALWQMRRPYLRALHEVVVRERNSSPMANE